MKFDDYIKATITTTNSKTISKLLSYYDEISNSIDTQTRREMNVVTKNSYNSGNFFTTRSIVIAISAGG